MSDRASRLREKRNRPNEKPQSQASNSSKPSKPSKTSETDETDKKSVKDEQVGTYLYLPELQRDEIKYQYKILSAEYEREFGEELEKNRHFYPLVVQYGLESLDGLDAQDVQELLSDLDY